MRIDLPTLADTDRLAQRIAAQARAGDFIGLSGPVGAGKTTFARAFLHALAARQKALPPAEVPSPTFTLVQSYGLGDIEVTHFDLYRIKDATEAAELGLDEAQDHGIVVVEWPERLGGLLPADRLTVAFAFSKAQPRAVVLEAHGTWSARPLLP